MRRTKDLRRPFVYAKVRTRQLPTIVRDAVFQNCVFQLSAILEDFISELIEHWFNQLKTKAAKGSALPSKVRAVAILRSQQEAFRKYGGDRDEGKLGAAIENSKDILSFLDDTAVVPNVDLHTILVRDKKFPSLNNITSLFKRLGLEKIDQRLSQRTKLTFDLNLRSFIDVRNALAHENPPSITDLDVSRYLKHIELWIDAIDREFFSFVVKTSGAKYW